MLSGNYDDVPVYPAYEEGQIVKLHSSGKRNLPLASGLNYGHVECPECRAEHWGAPRQPKSLVYRCDQCSTYFDVFGEVFKDCICRTGIMFVARKM